MPQSTEPAPQLDFETLEARIREGKSLGEIRGIDKTVLDLCYAVGSNAYKRRDYTTAYRAFLFLCLHDHSDPDHWIALGTVFVAQDQVERAIPLLTIAWNLDPNPHISYRLAEAYIRCGEKGEAELLLRHALSLLEEDKTQASLLARVQSALAALRSKQAKP